MSYWPEVEEELGMGITVGKTGTRPDETLVDQIVIGDFFIRFTPGVIVIKQSLGLGDKIIGFDVRDLRSFELDKKLTIGLTSGSYFFHIASMSDKDKAKFEDLLANVLLANSIARKEIKINLED